MPGEQCCGLNELFVNAKHLAMKRPLFFLFYFLFFFPFALSAQYSSKIVCGPNISPAVNYVYIGSLFIPGDNSANCQKLEVSVLGGIWGSSSVGESTFYIANRGGLVVNQTRMGSSGIGPSYIAAFQDGDNTNFYLHINSASDYYSFAVKSYFFGGLTQDASMVQIALQTNTPAGTDITASLNINPVLITDGSGNIGVNTATPDPAYKLSVNGKIRAKEVKVETGWADFVFDSSYQLRPLGQVQSFITQNHHLPDMPSSSQVEKEGISLGEMNKLLTQKVEELTLYLLAMKKEVDQLKKKGISRQLDK